MPYEIFTPVDISITPSEEAYTANDTVGGLLTFAMKGGNGYIHGVRVAVGEASITVAGTIYFYSASPTAFLDNAAFEPVHADNAKLMGAYTLPTALTLNTRSVYIAMNAGSLAFPKIPFWTGTIYAYYVTSDTPNFTDAAQNISIRLFTTVGG